jgi:hypothetical protein
MHYVDTHHHSNLLKNRLIQEKKVNIFGGNSIGYFDSHGGEGAGYIIYLLTKLHCLWELNQNSIRDHVIAFLSVLIYKQCLYKILSSFQDLLSYITIGS